jgi:hypothetical protein
MVSRINRYDYSVISGENVPLIRVLSAAESKELRKKNTSFLVNRIFIEKNNDIPAGSLVEFKLRTPDSDMYLGRGFAEWSNDGSLEDEVTGVAVKMVELYKIGSEQEESEEVSEDKADESSPGQPPGEEAAEEAKPEEEKKVDSSMSFTPSSSEIVELLESLIGFKPSMSEEGEMDISRENLTALASFVLDDGSVKILWVCDYRSVVYIGSALAAVPPETAQDNVESKEIPDNVMENFREVLNIGASLFNDPELPHISLDDVILSNDEIPEEIAILVSNPSSRIDFTLQYPDYGEGSMAILEQ